MSVELNGWYWVEWRNTLEPELFRDGRIQDHDGDWIMPSPTRKIGPRLPGPEEMKATELELAKLRNRVDDLHATFIETQEERDRLRADNAKYLDMIQKMYWTAGLISDGDELEAVKRLREERDRLRAEVERMRPKEKSGWRFFNCFNPKSNFWAVREVGYGVWFDVSRRLWFNSQQTIEKRKNDGSPELTIHEAYSRLADWPEGQRQFRELTGYEPPTCKESLPVQPEERVRCYKSPNHPHSIWVYHGDGDGVYFRHNFDEFTNADLLERSKYHDARTRIPLVEALEIVRDRPKQLAKLREMAWIETPHIAEPDENQKHLARLLAIPCKEMRV